MAAQGYVVRAETFYDRKLRKEGEIVAAGANLAAVYPSFFRLPQTDEEKIAAKGIVADYEAALKQEKLKKADAAGFTFKVKAETFFKTLRKAGDLVKSAERLDLMYPAYFALTGMDLAADSNDEAKIANVAAEAEVIGEVLAAAAETGIAVDTVSDETAEEENPDAAETDAIEAIANMSEDTGSMIVGSAENQSVTMSPQEGRASGKKANGQKAYNA